MKTIRHACIKFAQNPVYHGRAKHVEMKFHFIRDHIEKRSFELVYCPTEDMVADTLTKPLPKFARFREMMNVMPLGGEELE